MFFERLPRFFCEIRKKPMFACPYTYLRRCRFSKTRCKKRQVMMSLSLESTLDEGQCTKSVVHAVPFPPTPLPVGCKHTVAPRSSPATSTPLESGQSLPLQCSKTHPKEPHRPTTNPDEVARRKALAPNGPACIFPKDTYPMLVRAHQARPPP